MKASIKDGIKYYLPGLIFFIIGLLFVHKYAVNILYGDDWAGLTTVCRLESGKLHFLDLFAQHNEHRFFIVRLLFLGNYLIKPWDLTRLMYLSQVIALATSSLFLFSIRKEVKVGWLTAFLVPAGIFCLIQYDNFLWAYALNHTLCIFFFIAAVSSVVSMNSRLKKILAAFILCSLSTLSSGAGLFSFIALIPLIYAQNYSQKIERANYLQKAVLPLWLAATLIVYLMYFHSYHNPGHHPVMLLGLDHISNIFMFLTSFFGNIFITILNMDNAAIAGLVIISAYFFHFFRNYQKFPTLITIGSFGVLCGLAGVLTRGGFGVEQAFATKYTSPSLLLFLSVVIMSARSIDPKPESKVLLATFLALVFISYSSLPLVSVFHDRLTKCQYAFYEYYSSGKYSQYLGYPIKKSASLRKLKAAKKQNIDLSYFARVNVSERLIKEQVYPYLVPSGEVAIIWDPYHNVSIENMYDGNKLFTINGIDPYLISQKIALNAVDKQEIFIEIKALKGKSPGIKLFWATSNDPDWTESKSYELLSPLSDVVYKISIFEHKEWKGVITQLRIDPGDSADGRIILKKFEIVPTTGASR